MLPSPFSPAGMVRAPWSPPPASLRSARPVRNPSFLEIGQEIAEGQLKWFERFACACGHGFETGGVGLPAPGLRKSIIAQSGRAEVWVDDPKKVPQVLALLVKGLGVPEADAKKRLAKLPAVAFEGTHVEAAFICAGPREGRRDRPGGQSPAEAERASASSHCSSLNTARRARAAAGSSRPRACAACVLLKVPS